MEAPTEERIAEMLTLTEAGRAWALANRDDSMVAKLALTATTNLEWPLPYRITAVTAANSAARLS